MQVSIYGYLDRSLIKNILESDDKQKNLRDTERELLEKLTLWFNNMSLLSVDHEIVLNELESQVYMNILHTYGLLQASGTVNVVDEFDDEFPEEFSDEFETN